MRYELYPVAAALLLLVALLALKAKRTHDLRRRKASAVGYHDFDVARYGAGRPGTSLIDASASATAPSLSPTFVSPRRGSSRRGGRGAGAEPSFGTSDPVSDLLVQAFDVEEAQRIRPPTSGAPVPIPSAPELIGTARADVAVSSAGTRLSAPPSAPPSASVSAPPSASAPVPPAASVSEGLPGLVVPPPPPPGTSVSVDPGGDGEPLAGLPPLLPPPPPA